MIAFGDMGIDGFCLQIVDGNFKVVYVLSGTALRSTVDEE